MYSLRGIAGKSVVGSDRESRHCTYHNKEVFLSVAGDGDCPDDRASCESSRHSDANKNPCDARCAQSTIFNAALEIGKATGKDEEAIKSMLSLVDYALPKE